MQEWRLSLTGELSQLAKSQSFHLYLETRHLRFNSSNNLALITITNKNKEYFFIFTWMGSSYSSFILCYFQASDLLICHQQKSSLCFSKDPVLGTMFLILLAGCPLCLCLLSFCIFSNSAPGWKVFCQRLLEYSCYPLS